MCIPGLFPAAAPKPPAAPQRSDAEVAAAALAERRRAALATGRSATILTGGQGDLSPAPLGAKVLLGQ